MLDAADWMVGHPGTVVQLNSSDPYVSQQWGSGPKIRFDPLDTPPDYRYTHAYPDAINHGWWCHNDAVIPLRTVQDSHSVW